MFRHPHMLFVQSQKSVLASHWGTNELQWETALLCPLWANENPMCTLWDREEFVPAFFRIWMDGKRGIDTCSTVKLRLWLTIGHFHAKAKCSCIKYKLESWVHKRKGKRKRLTSMSSKSSWWRHIVFFQDFLWLFKLFTKLFFFLANSTHKKLFLTELLSRTFFVVVGQ